MRNLEMGLVVTEHVVVITEALRGILSSCIHLGLVKLAFLFSLRPYRLLLHVLIESGVVINDLAFGRTAIMVEL